MKICIFGAGQYGYEAYNMIACKWKKTHIFFCDNYTKEKESLNGIEIVDFKELKRRLTRENIVVIVATTHYKEIYRQCRDENVEIWGGYDIRSNSIVSYKTALRNEFRDSIPNLAHHFLLRQGKYIFLHNIFKTCFTKRCLILYIVEPFIKLDGRHTNQLLARTVAKVFQENCYNVDVARYDSKVKIDFDKYNVIFGFGCQFDSALRNVCTKSIKTIAFLTGAFPYYSNLAELKRLRNFENRNKVSLKLRRQCDWRGGLVDLNLLQNVDAGICIGNDWTCGTYENVFFPIHKITATGFSNVKWNDIHRNVDKAKKNFLWFGGNGNLHKGLDLCIEAFRKIPEVNLYIAGVMEEDFYRFYQDDLKRENIHYLGFVHVGSAEYKYLCEKCLFNIFPSCSEGCASSVLTTMFSGMIPVVTMQTGVDIEDFGFLIRDTEIACLTSMIKELSMLPNGVLAEKEEKTYKWALRNHTLKKFREDLSKIIKDI